MRYTYWEILAVVVFMMFCVGMVSIFLGITFILLGGILEFDDVALQGVSMLFSGLAIGFVCAGIGCFIPDKKVELKDETL